MAVLARHSPPYGRTTLPLRPVSRTSGFPSLLASRFSAHPRVHDPADPASTVDAVVEGHHPYLVRGRFRPLSSSRTHTDRSNLKSRVRKLGNRNGPVSFRVRLVPAARLDSLRRSGYSKTGRLCSSFSVSSKKAIVGGQRHQPLLLHHTAARQEAVRRNTVTG
jgi:hypothetical protein